MELRVVGKDRNYKLNQLKIGDLIKCEGDVFLPVKSILVIFCYGHSIHLSNRTKFTASPNLRIKTTEGIKIPEVGDIIRISKKLTPQVIKCVKSKRFKLFYDILIDGNIISPDGIIYRFGD